MKHFGRVSEMQITESAPALLKLSAADGALLQHLGQRLASTSTWWGASAERKRAAEEPSVVQVQPTENGVFQVTVRNMVGIIQLTSVRLEVVSKIPLPHFLHIIRRADIAPRLHDASTSIASSGDLLEVVAQWCVSEAEQLLRAGLRPDYTTIEDELSAIRGRVHPCDTALLALQGRAAAVCEYDELSDDAPLNRLIRAACHKIAQGNLFSASVRRRARAIVYRMDGVGKIRPDDLRAQVDRTSKQYLRPVGLARMVLAELGVSFSAGAHSGTSFLLRTPELIESGLRIIIADALEGTSVRAGRLMLGRQGLSVNPDLVFDGNRAVGDVKYKFLSKYWNRQDLYQSITFSVAYNCRESLIVGFTARAQEPTPQRIEVGDITTTAVCWCVDSSYSPDDSQRTFQNAIRDWYS